MQTLRLFFILPILFVILEPKALSHPVAYQGATGVMTWNQPFLSDDWITYSFRSDAAVAARIMRFDSTEGRMQFFAPQLDYLLKRWNGTDYQANIYVYGAFGVMNFKDKNDNAGLAGLEADAESRKYFVSAKYEKMWANMGPDFYHAEGRLGIAPYEAEFSEIATWFMLQYQYHPAVTREYSITPLARMFYKNFLYEAGVSTDGDWMLNFMFHF